jgi:serine/threonine-protein kinase
LKSPTSPERWRTISTLLDEILELPESGRQEHLDRACGSDAGLKEEVLAYFASGVAAGSFLEESPISGLETLSAPPGPEPSDDPEDPKSDTIGPYRLLHRIGRGGMGVVYLARRADGQFVKDVALKLVRRGLDTDEILARFRRERQILARFEHPHIARLLDGGISADGRPYLVMEYVPGEPITAWCDARSSSLEDRLRLFLEVCDTVQYAHRNLVVHRDLKPSNILVSRDGQVKLLDFGVAKVLADEAREETTLTRAGQRPMTPEYAAPEQALDAPLTTAADVYSLGVVLHELLVGPRPARGGGPPSAQRPQAEAARRRGTSPERLRRWLRGDLDTIVLKALQADPARRYRTVEALAEDLQRHRDELPIRARRDTWGYRTGKFLSRHRWGAGAAGLLALSLGAGMAGTIWQARQARREAAKARVVKDFTLSLFQVSNPHEAHAADLSARDLLDAGARRVDKELGAQPEIQAEMMQTLGRIDLALADYDAARGLLERALDLQVRLHGKESREAATAMHDLGTLRSEKGDYAEAEPLLREALRVMEALDGPDDVSLAPILSNLSEMLGQTGKYEEAEQADRRALRINQKTYGDDHLEVAMNLSDLGSLSYNHGRYAEAEDLFRRALRIREKHPDADPFDTDIVRHNLGGILAAQGSFAEAEPLMRQVLADRRKRLGPDHAYVAVSLDVLGNLLRDKGDYAEAGTMLREALDIRRRSMGPEAPSVALTLNNIAFLEFRRGDLESAHRLYDECLAQFKKTLPAGHPSVLTASNGLGMVMDEQGDPRAEPLLRQVLDERLKSFGDDHPQTAQSRYALAVLLGRRGKYAEAEELLRQAIAVRKKVFGDAHFSVAATQDALARVLREAGRLDDSLAAYQEVLAADRKVFARAGPQTADALVGLGRTLLLLDRPGEAEPLLREGLAVRQAVYVPGDRRTAEAKTALACALAGQGATLEAKRLLQEGLPVLERRPAGLESLLSAGRSALVKLQNARS